MRASLAPLRVRAFGRLLSAYTVNELGDAVGLVALAVLVYDSTGDALSTTALFLAAKFVPAFLAPVLTAHVDQRPLRRVLPAIYLLEGGVFAVLVVVAGSFSLPLVLGLAALDGILALTGRALTRAAVGGLLEPHGLLREGNALFNIGFAAASVGGAALGGFLVAGVGVEWALAVDAASFAAIALILASSRAVPSVHADREPFMARIREGVGYAWRNRVVRLLLGAQALALVLFTLIVPIEVIYAKETLDAGSAGYGLLLSAWGAGIVLGSIAYLWVKRAPSALLIVGSTVVIGATYIGMSVAPTLAVACALSIFGGTGNGVQWVAVVTALQEATPASLQARVMGLLESLGAAMPGVGFLLGGLLTVLASPRTAFAVAGVGLLALVAIGLLVAGGLAAAGARRSRRADPLDQDIRDVVEDPEERRAGDRDARREALRRGFVD
jgi:MFS family permease